MKYLASTEKGRFVPEGYYAVVTTNAAAIEALAARHARSMLGVHRAGRALVRAEKSNEHLSNAQLREPMPGCEHATRGMVAYDREVMARKRHREAVERLEAVEKEIRRAAAGKEKRDA